MSKFYYISATKKEDIEGIVGLYNEYGRKGCLCYYDDYPKHKYKSSGLVYIMELIPEKKYESTKYLCKCNIMFDKIELDKSQIIKVNNRYYYKEFEQKLNTLVWQEYIAKRKYKGDY